MTVPLDNLRGYRVRLQTEPRAHAFFDIGRYVAERADRSRELAIGYVLDGAGNTVPVALELFIIEGHFQAEGRGLGVDPVGPPHAGRVPVAQGEVLQNVNECVNAGDQDRSRLHKLYGEGGICDVARCEAEVYVTARRAHLLSHGGQERDNVMMDLVLYLEDPVHAEIGILPDVLKIRLRYEAVLGLDLADGDLNVEPDPELVLKVPDA